MRTLRSPVSLTIVVLCLILFVAAAPAASAVTVYVSSPSSSSVNTSFTLAASASSSNKVTGWSVYVDGNKVWGTPGPTPSISVPLNVSSGSHTVHVTAWDSSGASGSKDLGISASSSTSSSTGGVSVSIQSPANGSTVTSPVTFKASGSSPNGISGWVIYMDGGTKLYQVDNYSNSLSATVSVPSGGHSIYIRAWDRSNGSYGTTGTISIGVGSGSSGGTTTTTGVPTPPSNATVFSNIDNNTFNSCSANCAGGQSTTNYWQAGWQSSPSLDGSSRAFFNGGNAWANVLWYKEWSGYSWATNYLWDFYVRFNSGISDLHSAEFDFYEANHGIELMAGSQCNFGNGVWDTWNQAGGRWVPTSIPCKRFSPDTWHHIQWYVTRPANNQYKYNTLVVDGTAYAVNQTYYGSNNGWGDKVGVQYQLDLGPNGVDNKIWVDKVKLSIW